MRRSSTTTNTSVRQQHKRTEPQQQPQVQSAQHPASWQQLSFDLNVMTWQEEYKQRRKGK